jgi:hypothetical protein
VPPSLRHESGLECSIKEMPLPENYTQVKHEHILALKRENSQLKLEQEKFGDLIFTDHIDSYRKLPLKLKACYEFVIKYLPDVKWVLKIDDDFYVRLNMLERFLLQENQLEVHVDIPKEMIPNSSEPTVIGLINKNHRAPIKGQWKELPQWPTRGVYPPFPLGSSGHIVSRHIVEYVAKNKDLLFDFQGEDVSLGIWIGYSGMTVNYIDDIYHLRNNGNCYDSSAWIIGHKLKSQHMISCYDNDRNITINSHS